MKSYNKLTLALLFFTGILFTTACGSPVEHNPDEVVTLTEEDFQIRTLGAEVNEGVVLLSGSFTVDESKVTRELKWGFLWRRTNESDDNLRPIYIGRGHAGTDFVLSKDDFPQGVDIMACAFVEARLSESSEETTLMPGEEVEFAF